MSTDWHDSFKGKKITVMGLGLLGRGVNDVRFLAEAGADLIVTDLKSKEALAASLKELADFPDIVFHLGEHRLEDFRDRDLILKAAGVPMDSPFIAEARKNHIPVEMSTALFAAHTPAMLVGVTGTRGKSTVTHLLHAIFSKHAEGLAKKSQPQVFLGGNIRGVATLPFLAETKPGDIAVLELDSWQLQGFAEQKISPHIAVFTTFLPDHLNYYKNNFQAYFNDKAGIFRYQKPTDILIVGERVAADHLFKEAERNHEIPGTIVLAGEGTLPADWKLLLPGQHNRYNAGLALAAARAAGIPDEVSRSVVEKFVGVPGRLENIATAKGIAFYNDTTATTPDATRIALQALGSGITLIMGGADKMLDMSHLISELPAHVATIILLPGSGTERVLPELQKLSMPMVRVASMDEAVQQAIAHTKTPGTIVLSPAFASFGLFSNEFDRGDQFNAAVQKRTV